MKNLLTRTLPWVLTTVIIALVLYHIPADSAVEVEAALNNWHRNICTQLKIDGHQPEIQLKWGKLKELECDGVMKNWYEVTLLYKGGDLF